MNSIKHCLRSAVADIKLHGKQHYFLVQAIENFEQSILLAHKYSTLFDSIHWNSSSTIVKFSIRQKLHSLSFDCYTSFLLGTENLNSYVDTQTNLPVPSWWKKLMITVYIVDDIFNKCHHHQIYQVQLGLDYTCLSKSAKQ